MNPKYSNITTFLTHEKVILIRIIKIIKMIRIIRIIRIIKIIKIIFNPIKIAIILIDYPDYLDNRLSG